jgi:DNA helicase-2/ATP-dependent DNA helicase PcrA
MANPAAESLEAANSMETEVTTLWAGDALSEAEAIASWFETLHDQGTAWRDMAVLFRKNKDFAVMVDVMGRHDIPVEVANIGGLLSVQEVAELRAWLTVLEHPEDSTALIQILFGSKYRLGMADLAPLSRWASRGRALEDTEEPEPVTLIEAIEQAGAIVGLRREAHAHLERFARVYRDLLVDIQGTSLVEISRLVLDRTRAWQDIEALPPSQRLTARLNLYRFLDLAEDWSPLRGRPSVRAFLEYLSAMEDEPAEELDSARLSGEDAVTLVTIHRAKGLEWENVAVPAVTKGNFPSRAQQHPDPDRFAEHLPGELRIDGYLDGFPDDRKARDEFLRSRHNAQEWRVAYVALTRAKRRLLITGSYWYGLPEPSKTPKEPSELFQMVAGHPGSIDGGRALLGPRPVALTSSPLDAAPDPLFESGWEAGIRLAMADPGSMRRLAAEHNVQVEFDRVLSEITDRLFHLAEPAEVETTAKSRVISVTGLVTYAQCPKRFYWTDVDPLPRRPNPAAVRGTEIHRQIELHQRGQVPFEQFADMEYDAVEDRGSEGKGGYSAYLASRFAETRAALVEAPFTIALETGFSVRGRIDAVYIDGTRWEVVDFKSGRPGDDPHRVVQLEAYAVAVQDVDFGMPAPEVVDVTFAHLGGGLTETTTRADAEWVAAARSAITELTRSIDAQRFDPRPGPWCHNCDFTRFCPVGREWLDNEEAEEG